MLSTEIACNHPGRCTERPAPRDLDELDVHLNALARLRLLKQLHLPRHPLARPPQPRQAQIAKDALDRLHGHPDVVDPPKPQLRARSTVGELPACLSDQLDHARTEASSASPRIPGDQALKPTGTPPRSPAPNRPDAHTESARRRRRTVKPRII